MWFYSRGARRFTPRSTHTCIYKHNTTSLSKHMQSCGCKMKMWGKKLAKCWIGLTFIFMYLCIFVPHFGLGWYLVVQFCITSLTKGMSAASSFNKNNVRYLFLCVFFQFQPLRNVGCVCLFFSSTKQVIKNLFIKFPNSSFC